MADAPTAGKYELVAGIMTMGDRRYVQGDIVTLDDEQAARLMACGAVKDPKAKTPPAADPADGAATPPAAPSADAAVPDAGKK